jgi:transglutaminase-like putative cysteine protease
MARRSNPSAGRNNAAAEKGGTAFMLGLLALVLSIAPMQARAVTLNDLLSDSAMTPKRFADYFEDFEYEYHDEVQDPVVFLRTQRGDCDDYAILGDYVLARRGLETRLIHVRMVGQVAHDVCYVVSVKSYLDYNLRMYYRNLERSGPTVREIAARVADSFKSNWTSASEYTYTYDEGVKHMIFTVVKTDPPDEDPDFPIAR